MPHGCACPAPGLSFLTPHHSHPLAAQAEESSPAYNTGHITPSQFVLVCCFAMCALHPPAGVRPGAGEALPEGGLLRLDKELELDAPVSRSASAE